MAKQIIKLVTEAEKEHMQQIDKAALAVLPGLVNNPTYQKVSADLIAERAYQIGKAMAKQRIKVMNND